MDLGFTCFHLWKEYADKLSFFDPAPPLQLMQKVINRFFEPQEVSNIDSLSSVLENTSLRRSVLEQGHLRLYIWL